MVKCQSKKSSNEKKFICDLCSKGCKRFKLKHQIKDHIEQVHLNLRPFLCEHCGDLFHKSSPLKTHIRLKHSDEKHFQCPDCPECRFKDKPRLDQHMRTQKHKNKVKVRSTVRRRADSEPLSMGNPKRKGTCVTITKDDMENEHATASQNSSQEVICDLPATSEMAEEEHSNVETSKLHNIEVIQEVASTSEMVEQSNADPLTSEFEIIWVQCLANRALVLFKDPVIRQEDCDMVINDATFQNQSIPVQILPHEKEEIFVDSAVEKKIEVAPEIIADPQICITTDDLSQLEAEGQNVEITDREKYTQTEPVFVFGDLENHQITSDNTVDKDSIEESAGHPSQISEKEINPQAVNETSRSGNLVEENELEMPANQTFNEITQFSEQYSLYPNTSGNLEEGSECISTPDVEELDKFLFNDDFSKEDLPLV